MSSQLWTTRDPIDPAFEQAWRDRLSRAPHANFGFDPASLLHRAGHGKHSIAALIEDGDRRGAMVLREEGLELRCGWPWRWHVVLEGREQAGAPGLTPDDADWAFGQAERIAGGRRLRCYLPDLGTNGDTSIRAGSTLVLGLERTEDELFKSIVPEKRRKCRRAGTLGYQVIETQDPAHLRAFASLQIGAERRRGSRSAALDLDPPAGESWREWDLPWMWLLVALKDGEVVAGSGFGLFGGGMIDYRANSSTDLARKEGANVLLAWEALRLGRQRGFRWMNWGGATSFKQELGGERIPIVCRFGGGKAWAVANALAVSSRRARTRVAAVLRDHRNAAAERTRKSGSRSYVSGTQAKVWRTREPLDPAFEKSWKEVMSKVPLGNFSMDLRYLAFEAQRDRHAVAAILEQSGRRGGMVLRERAGGWACGWPWRWQAVIDQPSPGVPTMTPEDARWLFENGRPLAGGHRVRFFLPAAPPSGVPGYRAGATVIQPLNRTNEELLGGMHPSKRRMVRHALAQGYEIIEASTPEHFQAFARIQREAKIRRGQWMTPEVQASPPPGEDWREWELPWMWLVLAVRDGRIESGGGDGSHQGGVLEGRTAASTPEARSAGAFALICLEEFRRGRDHGHHWYNHGGDTLFKRQIAGSLGQRIEMHCWLGGGAVWPLANHSEALAWRIRPRLAHWIKSFRGRHGGVL